MHKSSRIAGPPRDNYDRLSTCMEYRKFSLLRLVLFWAAFGVTTPGLFAQTSAASGVPSTQMAASANAPASVCASCIRANMEFLASDALQGRGSGTHDELVAATFIAAQLRGQQSHLKEKLLDLSTSAELLGFVHAQTDSALSSGAPSVSAVPDRTHQGMLKPPRASFPSR